MGVIDPADLLSEDEVLRRWPMLTKAELRRARRATPPKIEFYGFRKKSGGPGIRQSKCRATLTLHILGYLNARNWAAGRLNGHPTAVEI
jgi:hypothetical protein